MVRSREAGLGPDPYRGVVLVLIAAVTLGAPAAFFGGVKLGNPVMLAAGITLALAAGALASAAKAQRSRAGGSRAEDQPENAEFDDPGAAPVEQSSDVLASVAPVAPAPAGRSLGQAWRTARTLKIDLRRGTAILGAIAVWFLLFLEIPAQRVSPWAAGSAIAACLAAAALAWMTTRYFSRIDPADFPESVGLNQVARITVWVLAVAAVSAALAWANLRTPLRVIYFAILALNGTICYQMFRASSFGDLPSDASALNLGILQVLGSRPNMLASALDAAERQLGIDLRSTWALTLVRRSLEPLVLSLLLAAWLSTSFSVVGMQEQGVVERLGVPQANNILYPGLHLHFPWPIDRVFRVPVTPVESIQVGHEGEEKEGPENVLWAVEHAPNEYTLLLGNGRDLITVDASVEYRIVNPYAWRYSCQNPEAALKAIAYRAVMRSTVNLTLSEALSQNISLLTANMKQMVQKEADDLGLGVDILAFTVSGMHPPVPVASAYEAVVSAELGKVTAAVNAQAYRNQTVPAAESSALSGENTARAEGAEALAKAAGQAWSFRTLESNYRAAPGEYFFRRRLETLESTLPMYSYTVLDNRFLRDGGEVWTTR